MRLIIATSPRTGSNLLIHSLATHPAARAAGEVFNNRYPVPLVRELLKQGENPFQRSNLFKVFPHNQTRPEFWPLLDSALIVYLYRQDREAQLASWRTACETGYWVEEVANPVRPMEFPAHARTEIEEAEQLFRPRAQLSISYEQLITHWEPITAAIQGLMGWPIFQLAMQRKKLTPRTNPPPVLSAALPTPEA